MPVLTRPSIASDIPAVDELCYNVYGSEAGVHASLETALLCLTAVDGASGHVVGFLCLNDAAAIRFGTKCPDALSWLMEQPSALAMDKAFVKTAAFAPEFEVEASTALLRGAFLAVTSLKALMLATDKDITFTEPGLGSIFSRVACVHAYLYEAPRAAALPPLSIRRACVEDHDDLVPIMEASAARFPALAKLPESCRPEEAFALTRLVANQDERNCVLVAVADKQLMGFMVITSEVDTGNLLGAFDLHPFDNFLSVEVYEQQYNAAKDKLTKSNMEQLTEKLVIERHMGPSNSGALRDADTETEDRQIDDRGSRPQSRAQGSQQDGVSQSDMTAAAEPTEEDIKQEMLRISSGAQDTDESNTTLFAMTMLCVAEECEVQAMEFLRKAFEAFSDKDYCVVTLPHDSREPALMSSMTRLPPLPGASFAAVLYLFNRNALLDGFAVRRAVEEDAESVNMLVAGMPNSDEIKDAFKSAEEHGNAIVAFCQGEVVGLVTISSTVNLDVLQANFSLGSLVSTEHHEAAGHGEIDIYCMNPIFAHRHRELLSGAQRLLKRSCLYYALPPGQAPPDMLEVLQQVPPRHRQVDTDAQAQFSLYVFTRKGAFLRKQAVNAQILVVGASECGLAAVERLLLNPFLSFNYVTLLAPGGISVGGPACEYTAGVVARLGLEARVSLVDGELICLDVQQRLAELSEGAVLPYDLLLVTSGLQEQTRGSLGEKDPEAASVIFNAMELGADFTSVEASTMRHIVVYGGTIEAYHALAILERSGASDRSSFFSPPDHHSPLVEVLLKCAEQVKLELPQPRLMVLTALKSVPGSNRPHIYFEGQNEADDSLVDLLVACMPRDVSPWMFASLNDAGIVYDGRIVVDGSFRTSNSSIYAAGTAAKLSRRFGQRVHFEHYNSKESGVCLADSVASIFTDTAAPEQRPVMRTSRVVGCDVPGGKTFLFAGTPTAMMQPSLEAPAGGSCLATSTEAGFLHICINKQKQVHCIAYLGQRQMQASKLGNLVGLPSSYLNGLLHRFKAGEVPDLVDFLNQPWAELLHHDGFRDLRIEMLQQGAVAGKGEMPPNAEDLQEVAIELLQAWAAELPSYGAGLQDSALSAA